MDQPPPPPPHGGVPKSSGLPPGKYDIFVIPQHSSGSGFLYLPSLQPNVNSFAAGFACGLIFVVIIQNMAPAFQTWWTSYPGMGSTAMSVLMVGVGIGAWVLGRTQQNKQSAPPPRPEHASGPGGSGAGSGSFPGSSGARPGSASGPPPPPPPHSDPPPRPGPPPHHDPPPHSGPPPRSAADSAPPPRPPSPPPPEPEPKPEKPKAERPKAEKPKADKPKAEKPKAEKPKPTWQRQQSGAPKAEAPKGSWEKAREETRRREEERKAREEEQKRQEEEQKRRDEVARKLREQRERETRERDQREREARERREKLEAERRERMEYEKREKELREKLERERLEREKLQRDKEERDRVDRLEREKLEKLERERLERLEREKFIKEAREREAREREAREKELEAARKKEEEEVNAAKRSGTYAYSSRGEKINPWPNGKPKAPPPPPSSTGTGTPPRHAPSTTFTSPTEDQRGPAPSATSYTGTEDDMYSYRPYDKPKQGGRRRNSLSSETSWTPSHTTARTTPPPSMRAPYTTKDPDKIVIKAVYLFLNQFSKTPVSQLVSGFGSVTDGLILRSTTEGLFIDDDVRGVPQREWDVKAWTLKQVEVWCPPHCLTPSPHTPGSAAASSVSSSPQKAAKIRDRGAPKLFAGDDADTYLTEMLRACKDCCRMGLCEATFRNTNIPAPAGQTGEWSEKGLHLLRATIRDQEAKRYLFVLGEEESWKVPVGLQRLRRGTQARALGVGSMTSVDARGCLELLGWV